MITAIVLGILVVCVGIYCGNRDAQDRRRLGYEASAIGSSAGPLRTCLILAVFVGLIGSLPTRDISGDLNLEASYRIYSLRHFDATEGEFFLGCGSIGGVRRYAVFRETGRGMRQAFYDTYDTYIQEDGGGEPYAEYYRCDTKHWVRMAFPLAWISSCVRPRQDDYWVLHVPKGTVAQEFSLE